MRRILAVLALVLALVLIPTMASADAATVTTACPTGWGSLPKTSAVMGTGEVDTVRTGQHPCFDRLVIDIDGPPAGYDVRYVDEVTADGSGAVVPTPGGARIQVTVHHPSYSSPRLPTTTTLSGYRTFRSVTWAGSFEGYTSLGLGVRARLPFRVFTIPGGHGRIVVDVAHHW